MRCSSDKLSCPDPSSWNIAKMSKQSWLVTRFNPRSQDDVNVRYTLVHVPVVLWVVFLFDDLELSIVGPKEGLLPICFQDIRLVGWEVSHLRVEQQEGLIIPQSSKFRHLG